MPKVMIIECSDEEADRLVEQIKSIIAEPQYQPFRGRERFMNSAHCGLTSPSGK